MWEVSYIFKGLFHGSVRPIVLGNVVYDMCPYTFAVKLVSWLDAVFCGISCW